MMTSLRKYFAFSRLNIERRLAFKWDAIWSIFTTSIKILFNVLLWSSIFATNSKNIAGFSLKQIIAYYVISQFIVRIVSTSIDRQLSREIARGQIMNRLLRPVDLFYEGMFKSFGDSMWTVVFEVIPLLILAVLFLDFNLNAKFVTWIYFLISLIISFYINYSINFLAGLSAVWLKGSEGVIHAKDFVSMITSGAIIPLSFFVGFAMTLISLLPFKFIVYIPMIIFLEKGNVSNVVVLLGQGIIWCMALTVLCRLCYKSALKHLAIYNG